MIVLLIILLVAAVGGIAAYLILQYTNVLPSVPDEPRLGGPTWQSSGGRFSVPGRLEEVPQGCLVSVLVFMAVWILLWLVVLILGLRVLLA